MKRLATYTYRNDSRDGTDVYIPYDEMADLIWAIHNPDEPDAKQVLQKASEQFKSYLKEIDGE